MIDEIRKAYLLDPTSISTAFWKFEKWYNDKEAKLIKIGPEEVLILNTELVSYCGDDLLSIDISKYTGINTLKPYQLKGYKESKYFVLYHELEKINKIDHKYSIEEVLPEEVLEVVDFINKSYEFISVNEDQVMSWRQEEVFDSSLWIWIIEDDKKVALGIAERDRAIQTGALEWIQVAECARGKKIGQIMVNELLTRMKDLNFVTVSGEIDNSSNPEMLYKKCGFIGDKTWYYYKR